MKLVALVNYLRWTPYNLRQKAPVYFPSSKFTTVYIDKTYCITSISFSWLDSRPRTQPWKYLSSILISTHFHARLHESC